MKIIDLLAMSISAMNLCYRVFEDTIQAMLTHKQHNDDSLFPEATRCIILLHDRKE